jgi:hypothetical protein
MLMLSHVPFSLRVVVVRASCNPPVAVQQLAEQAERYDEMVLRYCCYCWPASDWLDSLMLVLAHTRTGHRDERGRWT